MNARGGTRRRSGSATVELVVAVPFVLALLAVAWDIREYTAFRTEVTREIYPVAEAIANDIATSPIEQAMQALADRFHANSTAGSLQVAIVVRGTQRPDGTACQTSGDCTPMVRSLWPANGQTHQWADAGQPRDCGSTGRLPAAGVHFGASDRVLPNENASSTRGGTATPPAQWVSRNIDRRDWWVVVDACFEPDPGLFASAFTSLSLALVDTSALTIRRRTAWPSVHDLADCTWC